MFRCSYGFNAAKRQYLKKKTAACQWAVFLLPVNISATLQVSLKTLGPPGGF